MLLKIYLVTIVIYTLAILLASKNIDRANAVYYEMRNEVLFSELGYLMYSFIPLVNVVLAVFLLILASMDKDELERLVRMMDEN